MNNQKDTLKTSHNATAHAVGSVDVQNNSIQVNNDIYKYATKKTEKLVTALYMITDYMETDDALKASLRELGVTLLRDICTLPIISPAEKHTTITLVLNHISQVDALIEIAHTIGFVSEMNATILKKEFDLLRTELHSYQAESQSTSFGGALFENHKNASFALSSQLFAVDETYTPYSGHSSNHQEGIIKDSQTVKRTPYALSLQSGNTTHGEAPKRLHSDTNPNTKQERTAKLLALIKDKKDIAIKDIIYAFTDCSEKTIQRELNALVDKGQIKKTGAKRWSRYQSND